MTLSSTQAAGERTRPAQRFAVILAATAIAAVRRPDAFWNPQFFVEDGTVFFADNHALGPAAVLKPYAGYLHLLPRLVALLSSLVPCEYQPAFYNGSALLLLWGFLLLLLRERVPLPNRPAFALAPMLIPIGSVLYLHLTNVQWFGALALLVMLIQRPAARIHHFCLDILVIVLLGLTGPFSLLVLPLWSLRTLHYGPSPYELLMFAVLAAAATVQGVHLLAAREALAAGGFGHVDVPYLSRHAATLLTGRHWPLYLKTWNWVPALVLLLGLVALAIGIPRGLRLPARVFIASGLLFTVVGLYRIRPEAGGANAFLSGSRYFLIPHVCAAWCALLALPGRPWARAVGRGLLLMFLLSSATRFDRHRPEDFHWASYCDRIRSGAPVDVPINWPGWRVSLNRSE